MSDAMPTDEPSVTNRDIYIRVNHQKLAFSRRFQLARVFAWLAWMQLIGRDAQLNLSDVADGPDARAQKEG